MADRVERSDPRRASMSRNTRILFGTLVVGFLGVIVTGSIGVYSENRADRRAVVGFELSQMLSRFDELSRNQMQIRDEVAAGFAAAAAERAEIRDEAAADRAAIRDALREQGDTVLLATLCLIDLVRQWPATGPSETGAPDARSALGSASCDRLERLAAVR